MRIILSRKGFDASYGGKPSPIFPDGTLYSLPIPEDQRAQHAICYGDVNLGEHNLGQVVQDLTKGKVQANNLVHLDPDLNPSSMAREPEWRPSFGQISAAESHLRNQGVTNGDLFLFFGWFKAIERVNNCYRYVKCAPDLHVLFGWLQIDSRLPIEATTPHPTWLSYHPHIKNRDHYPQNTIYLSRQSLALPAVMPDVPGAGIFKQFSLALQLTASTASSRGIWELPRWFHPQGRSSTLSYHSTPSRWQLTENAVHLRTVGRGQEFVLDCQHYPEAMDWLANLFNQAVKT
jgi:hypothetical protein